MAEQKLRYVITGDATQLNGALNRASLRLKTFGQGVKNLGSSLTRVAAPLALVGGAAIKMGVDFDKSMTKIKSLVGVASEDVDKMRTTVREMAVETGVSSNKAADALFFITSAGLRGKEAMDVLEASLKASAVGLGEVSTVADLSTSALNAYSQSGLTAMEATDVLTAAVREGKLNSEELAGSMGQVLPVASGLGVSFNEVGAAMAAMSRTGTQASIGATQLRSVLNSLLKPSEGAKKQLAAFGLSAQGLRKQIKDEGLLSVLNTLKQRFEGNDEAAAKVFPNVRALSAVLNLTGDNAAATEKIFAALNATQDDTQKAFEETSKSASFRLTKSLNEAKESFAEMGAVLLEALLPVIQDLAKFVTNAFKKFNNLEESTQKFIGTIAIVGTVLGPVLIVIGSMISALGTIAGALGTAKTAFALLNKTMRANPFVAVAGLIMGVVLALKKLKRASDAAKMEAFNEELKNMKLDEAETKLKKLAEAQENANKKIEKYNEAIDNNISGKGIAGLMQSAERLKKENKLRSEQINLLQDFIKLKKEEQEVDKEPKITTPSAPTGTTGTTGTEGPTPEEIAQQTAAALLTTKKKQFDAEIAATKAHYTKLIELNKGNDEQIKQLEISKGEKLKEISDGYYGDLFKSFEDYATKRSSLQTKIEDASAVTDEQRKALEIKRTQEFYGKLIEQAKLFHLDFSALQDAMTLKIEQITNGMSETTSNFKSSQENINSVLQGSFSSLGNSIANTFGASQSLLGGFLQTFISTAVSIMAANNATASSDAVKAGTQTALSFGPAASFVLPALVAASLGVVAKSFGSIKKFAKGGIVSTPTMGLFGEYPGARSNPEVVAPLDKLTGMLGGGAQQNVQVAGEFTLRGQDLIVALQRANRNRDRIN